MIPVSSSPEFIEGQSIHLGCRLRLAQMRQTIFFAVARHPKFEVWIGHFRRSTNRATMQCLCFRFVCLRFETTTSCGYFMAVAGITDDRGAGKDQIIRERAKYGNA